MAQIKNGKFANKNTSIEKKVKLYLLSKNIEFEQQYTIGRKFLADFFLPKYDLVIECDCMYWHNRPENKQRDFLKDKLIKEIGLRIFRLSEKFISRRLDNRLFDLICNQNIIYFNTYRDQWEIKILEAILDDASLERLRDINSKLKADYEKAETKQEEKEEDYIKQNEKAVDTE